MAWVEFSKAHDHAPKRGVIIAYPAGWRGRVTRRCADEAIAKGRAVELRTPGRDEARGGRGC